MSKFMSVFEKLNLVEKVSNETSKSDSIDRADIEGESIKAEQNEEESNVEASDSIKEIEQVKNDSKSFGNISIKDIYNKFGIKGNGINTIFMLEKFINALPEKLPLDVKKESVINILEASDTDLNLLISDGEKRLDLLNNFAKDFSNSTTESIEKCKSEIVKLNNLIKNYEEQIYLSESMIIEQNNEIKAETEKINSTINFFKNSN